LKKELNNNHENTKVRRHENNKESWPRGDQGSILDVLFLNTKIKGSAIYLCPGPKDQVFQDKINTEDQRLVVGD